MVKIEGASQPQSGTSAAPATEDERTDEGEKATMADKNLPPAGSLRTDEGEKANMADKNLPPARSRRCVVCSAEVPMSVQDIKLFSSLSEFEKRACSLLRNSLRLGPLSDAEDGVVCQPCFAKVTAFLSGREEIGTPQDTPKKDSSSATDGGTPNETSGSSGYAKYVIPAVVGGAVAVVAAPLAVAAAGFGAGGIAAGSLAASMMSSAWTTGVGVGVVSTLQSAGAAGIGATAYAATAGVGAGVGAGLGRLWSKVRGGGGNGEGEGDGGGGGGGGGGGRGDSTKGKKTG